MAKSLQAVAVLLAVLVGGTACEDARAQQADKKKLTLERLYSYPRLEGTAPLRAKWSSDSRYVAFLWNDQGMPFRDLWLYDAESGQLRRLTDLDQPRDQWTENPAAKDPKLRRYLGPETGLGNFEWAPDAQKLAFAFRGEIYVIGIADREPLRLTKTKTPEFRPRFSPDAKKLAYASERELWVLDLETGQRTQLTSGGSDDILNGAPPFPASGLRTFAWSPDSRWLALLQVDRSGEATRWIPTYSGTEVRVREQRRTFARDETPKVRLGIVPAAGGEVVWLTPAERQYYYDWQWSPDSTRIALNRVEENWKKRHLDIVDVAGALEEAKEAEEAREKEGTAEDAKGAEKEEGRFGWVRTIYSEEDDKWMCTLCDFVEWSAEETHLLFSSEQDGWNHLYLINVESQDVQQLTRGAWEVETRGFPLEMRPRFDPDGKWIYFTSNQEDYSRRDLYRMRTAGGAPERLSSWEGYNAALASPDGARLALLFSSFAEPWDLYVRVNKADTEWERVTHSPLEEFADYQWPQPRIVEFPARDGKTVRALLFAPTELRVDIRMYEGIRLPGAPAEPRPKKPTKEVEKVPVINFVHGAGYAQAVLNRWGGYFAPRFQFNQFLAQHGYAVIDVDYRGSSGYGREWRTDVYLHLGGKDLEDELAAMDYLKTLGWVDAERAGIWGVSYGGFMTLMVMFLSPDTFQAGSAWAAVTDWANYQRHYTQQRLRTPEEEPEAYRRSSPLHHVEGLKNPLQLQHGMQDDNVHFQDAVQLIDALVAAGKDFELVVYPLSRHGWSRPEVWLHSTRQAFVFFERHLKKE